MGLDAGRVLKRPVLCPHCNEEYLFTLRAIADNPVKMLRLRRYHLPPR